MTNVERRFTTAMREADSDDPGLIQEDDGTVWLVDPDGTRTQLPGTGGGLPAGGSTGEVLTKASNADGDADWEAGGGSQPVPGVILQCNAPPDIGAGSASVVWDAIMDFNYNPLPGFPDGFGLAFNETFNFLTSEAGIWSFELDIQVPADPDVVGFLGVGVGVADAWFVRPQVSPIFPAGGGFPHGCGMNVASLPAGNEFGTSILVSTLPSVGSPFVPLRVYCQICRVA